MAKRWKRPRRLARAESPRQFEKRLRRLPGFDRIALSSVLRLLIDKGLVTQLELQQSFLDECERRGELSVFKESELVDKSRRDAQDLAAKGAR